MHDPVHTFKVGETAKLCNTYFHPQYEGEEVLIVAALSSRIVSPGVICLCYLVNAVKDGKKFYVRPHQLRPKLTSPEKALEEKV